MSSLKKAAGEALKTYPEIKDIRLIGSIARGDHSGLTDIDLFIVTDSPEDNPIERMRPYFEFLLIGFLCRLMSLSPLQEKKTDLLRYYNTVIR